MFSNSTLFLPTMHCMKIVLIPYDFHSLHSFSTLFGTKICFTLKHFIVQYILSIYCIKTLKLVYFDSDNLP